MKKIFCDFCGGEIKVNIGHWFKVIIKKADGNDYVTYVTMNEDACYDCAKRVNEWMAILLESEKKLREYDDTGEIPPMTEIINKLNNHVFLGRLLKITRK